MKYFFVKKYWKFLVLILVISFVANFALVFASFWLSYAIQFLVENKNISSQSLDSFYYSIIAIIGAGILGYFLIYINWILKEKYAQKVNNNLRNIFISNLNERSFTELKDMNSDVSHNWINNDIKIIYENGISNVLKLFDVILTVIFSIISLAILNWVISIIACLLSIMCLFIPSLLGKKIEKIGTKFGKDNQEYFGKIYKNISNIRNLFFLNRLDIIISNLIKNSQDFKKNKIEFSRRNLNIMLTILIFNVVSQVLVMILTGVFSVVNSPVVPTISTAIFSVTALAGNIFGQLQTFANGLSKISIARSFVKKDIFAKNKKVYKYNKNVGLFNNLNFKNVNLTLGGTNILKNINLSLNVNKKYLIIGASDSGKSSLASLITKMNNNYSGNILWDEKELKDIHFSELNNFISYSGNKGYFFIDSLVNNITLYDDNPNVDLLNKSLDFANCDFINKNQLNNYMDEKVFSTGQLQRLLIARSFYQNKRILIFDETLSNLDKKNSKTIEEKILNENDVTFIHITHHVNDSLLKLYDQVITINKGEISNV